jgi:hypothetical protein
MNIWYNLPSPSTYYEREYKVREWSFEIPPLPVELLCVEVWDHFYVDSLEVVSSDGTKLQGIYYIDLRWMF